MVAITAPVPLRLPAVTYRRRRLAALGLLLVLAALSLALVARLTGPSAGEGRLEIDRAASVTYVVRPGDTLWSIAERLAPGTDPRPVVDALAAANGGATLVAGQVIELDLP